MNFELVSEFEPSEDQAEAIEGLCTAVAAGDDRLTLLGVTGSGKTYTMAKVIEQLNRPGQESPVPPVSLPTADNLGFWRDGGDRWGSRTGASGHHRMRAKPMRTEFLEATGAPSQAQSGRCSLELRTCLCLTVPARQYGDTMAL